MNKKILHTFLMTLFALFCSAQSPSSIQHELEKLGKFGRVLYLAAHPDDENTRMITWLANDAKVTTAYLSLTRGDGGQNLIGPQLGEALGVIRTGELLEARAIDGGIQYFSRAVDFGYSKNPEETFEKWNKEEVLKDVVTVIRKFKPDIIITRFPPDERAGHGHHTASAILGIEAFERAADSTYHPESVDLYGSWQSSSLFWNTSRWWVDDIDSSKVGDGTLLYIDAGTYNLNLGKSHGELASMSRSMHKSQGFGIALVRGEIEEYLELMEGKKCYESLFENVDTSFSRFVSDDKMIQNYRDLLRNYNVKKPWESVPALFKLHGQLHLIENQEWREEKRQALEEIILQSIGFHAEALALEEKALSGSKITYELQAINRSPLSVSIIGEKDSILLPNNKLQVVKREKEIKNESSHPFYLQKPYGNLFTIDETADIFLPVKEPEQIEFQLLINDYLLTVKRPLEYKWTDRVKGERHKLLEISPAVLVDFSEEMLLFKGKGKKSIRMRLHAPVEEVSGRILLTSTAAHFTIEPQEIEFSLKKEGYQEVEIHIQASKEAQLGELTAQLNINDKTEWARHRTVLDFDHLSPGVLFPKSQVQLRNIDLKTKKAQIGYIEGAGDEVPEALRKMGYHVSVLSREEVAYGDLSGYDAIIAGIRAYNTNPWLVEFEDKLINYAQKGGNYIIQYVTVSWRSQTEPMGKLPFNPGRARVTNEKASVRFLPEAKNFVKKPNALDSTDFDHWVQERGLYFAASWEVGVHPLFEMADPGEEAVQGSTVVWPHGKGHVIYTGLSFFRQLPAGVPGAYRIMANLIHYGK